MALKALGTRRAKTVAKTLQEMLAQVFTASKTYAGRFDAEHFDVDYDGIVYRGDDIEYEDDVKEIYYSDRLAFEIPFKAQESNFCCGFFEIGEFRDRALSPDPDVSKALMTVYMAALALEYNMLYATTTTTQKVAKELLASVGFEDVATFKSKTTGSTITVHMKDFTGEKFLNPGDMNLTEFDFKE